MGRRSVKKQKFVTMELFQEFCELTRDVIDAVDASLDGMETQIKNCREELVNHNKNLHSGIYPLRSEHEKDIKQIKDQAVKDLGLMSDAIGRLDARLKPVENIAYNPVVSIHTGQVTEAMLNELKKSVPNPVMVSTPPDFVKCNKHNIVDHRINGVFCNSITSINPHHNASSYCSSTLEAVRKALRKMHNIEFVAGATSFLIRVKCQNHWRNVSANFYDNSMLISYYRRNGRYVEERHTKVSTAAADLTAIVMYYATR